MVWSLPTLRAANKMDTRSLDRTVFRKRKTVVTQSHSTVGLNRVLASVHGSTLPRL